jgi:hypothetical protein
MDMLTDKFVDAGFKNRRSHPQSSTKQVDVKNTVRLMDKKKIHIKLSTCVGLSG